MLDRSSKLDDSLMDAYRSIHEIHKGHAAGESDIEKQASQLASDIRYKAKGRIRDGMNAEDKKRIYLKLLSASPAPGIVKNKAKRKLLGESVELVETPYSGKGTGRRENIRKNPIGLDQSDPAARQKVSNTAKKVVRGGEKVARRVAKGVIGIAKREGTLSQKVTGAAIDAVKGRVGGAAKKVVGKVIRGAAGIARREGTLSQKVTGAAIDAVKGRAKKALKWSDSKTKKADTSSSTYNPSSTSYSKKGVGRKEKVSSSQSKSATTSSYKARSEKKKTQQASTPQPQTSQSSRAAARKEKIRNLATGNTKNPHERAAAKAALGRMKEGFSNWKLELLGEDGYDKWRDKDLEYGGMGAV